MPFLSSRYHVSTVMVVVAGGGGASRSRPSLDEVIEFCRFFGRLGCISVHGCISTYAV